jgi:uncharacterized protein (TIGR00730 family)
LSRFRSIAVFCGSSDAVHPEYKQGARALGELLGRNGVDIVYGGGRVGLMGALADGALDVGGKVIGVIPHKLMDLELGHTGCTELIATDGMHLRKKTMAERANAFIAMPGGYGTMEELFEAVTWTQLNYHDKPVGLLNIRGYFDPLLLWLDRAVADGFVGPQHRELMVADTDPESLLLALDRVRFPSLAELLASRDPSLAPPA